MVVFCHHDAIAEGRWGEYQQSQIVLNDYVVEKVTFSLFSPPKESVKYQDSKVNSGND